MAASNKQVFHATGKRKSAIARVYMQEGAGGGIEVNGRPHDQYFSDLFQSELLRPLKLLEKDKDFKIEINVAGGGVSAQADACGHGISKALTLVDPEFRSPLKKAMLLTRDSRVVERKKYGHKKARKSFQFSKR